MPLKQNKKVNMKPEFFIKYNVNKKENNEQETWMFHKMGCH